MNPSGESSITASAVFLADGFSQNRPPKFEGAHYGYWKNRMELFIQSTNPALWRIVIDGPIEVASTVENLVILKLNVLGVKRRELSKLPGMVLTVMKKLLKVKTLRHSWLLLLNLKSVKCLNRNSSGCSHNMTGNKDLFFDLKQVNKGKVCFGDNSSSKIIGIGSIRFNEKTVLDKVFLVEGLKHNLLSISQICGKNKRVIFESNVCYVESFEDHRILFSGYRRGDIYVVNFHKVQHSEEICLITVKKDEKLAWHRKLGHVSIGILSKLSSLDLVKGLPKLDKTKDFFCDACAKGKQTRSSFKSKSDISSKECLDLIHLDLFGPASSSSLGGKSYVFVLVDDFSRYSWIFMLSSKDETFSKFKNFVRRVQNEKNKVINEIRSDHGGEFENHDFENLCNDYGIRHNFSAPRTPQQNGVVERKNRTLVEIARTLLHDFGLPKIFWGEAVNTACYITNRALVRSPLKKTPYEIWKGRKPNIGYFRPFGCKCFILNTKDQLGKFDAKSDEGIFLGYSDLSKAYRVYNKRTFKVEESINVIFDESVCVDIEVQDLEDEDFGLVRVPILTSSSEGTVPGSQDIEEDKADSEDVDGIKPPPHIAKRHPASQVIGDPSSGMVTRSRTVYNAFVSIIEPKNYKDALTDESWILAMNEELNQFERSDVWTLVPQPENRTIIGSGYLGIKLMKKVMLLGIKLD
ncbi:Retrovirus-related Pol polyprotein from transposon TNT 1-94 [Linum perenne]